MASLNSCSFIGNLGKDPESRYLQDGTCVANFSLACNESWKDKDGEKKEKTEWVRIVAWGKLGEICEKYLTKGKQVFIQGRMQTREWEDKEGVTRYSTEIVADKMVMLGGKPEDGGERHTRRDTAEDNRKLAAATTARKSTVDDLDDDIPF